MAICNTYRLFIAVATFALSSFAFADGVCYLEQTLPDGSYIITCEGDGIVYNYVTQTNVVVANCEELKTSILHEVDSNAYFLQYGYSYLDDMSNSINVLRHDGANVDALEGDYLSFRGFYDDAILSFVGEDGHGGLRQYIDENMICGSCSTNSSGGSSGGGSCCNTDLTPILESLNYGHYLSESLLSTASNVVLQLQYTNFLLEHGFHDATNLLANIRFDLGIGFQSVTNILNSISLSLYDSKSNAYAYRKYYKQSYMNSSYKNTLQNVSPYFYSFNNSDFLRSIARNIYGLVDPILSLNNYWYDYSFNRFPILTNTVGTLTTATTNFFTFFRGEIGVKGVLGDWTADAGTYYDFLTNHYLKVVNGEQIQGSAASKTNWFSRIETLLAALVFADSESTNTVNTSSGTTEQSQLSAGYSTINASASTSSQGFRRSAESIVSLYRRFGTAFDGAALPAHVLLIRATSSDDRVVEIGFDVSSGISGFVEACRLVCTFCWASVGIFLLYRFMVWATNCVVHACMFVYQIVSRLFK